MGDFEEKIGLELESIRGSGLWRELRCIESVQGSQIYHNGKKLINFSSNDYLGLAGHHTLTEAAKHAIDRFGVGSGASRLVCGSLEVHHELEEALARWLKAEAALVFSSGFAAAQGVISSIVGSVNIFAGILTTIQQFLKISEYNEAHRACSISWGKFYRNIKVELAKDPRERTNVKQLIKTQKEEFDRLMEISPPISEKIIKRFKNEFCNENSIVYQGFSLLTANPFVLPHLSGLAEKYNQSPEQIIFRFSQQLGILPLTGTTNSDHMAQDLTLPFDLSDEEIKAIEQMAIQ